MRNWKYPTEILWLYAFGQGARMGYWKLRFEGHFFPSPWLGLGIMYVGDVHVLLSKIVAAEVEVVGGVTVCISHRGLYLSSLYIFPSLAGLKRKR